VVKGLGEALVTSGKDPSWGLPPRFVAFFALVAFFFIGHPTLSHCHLEYFAAYRFDHPGESVTLKHWQGVAKAGA
jgi:hypothetical protein